MRILPGLLAALTLALPAAAGSEHDRPTGIRLEPLYALTSHKGRNLVRREVRGRPLMIVFGYTSCPEVCPTSLFDASRLLDELGPDAQRLNVVFISIDPERDTPEHLRSYLESFHPRITGLTGTPEQVAAVSQAFKAPFEKNGTGDLYSMSHASDVFLIDRYGLLADAVPYTESASIAAVARKLLAQ